MRFQRFPHHKARGITPRRLAASKRRLQKERDKFPLLTDWIAEQQPTPEERILTIDDSTVLIKIDFKTLKALQNKSYLVFIQLLEVLGINWITVG